ncbi:hypothetical protein QE417_003151 [Mucilaginibacter terrae]|uniref:Carboxypeptidase-like regulatory domain-containing protein n=2 Tax=Mucilaginibacter terrae TaxID=1955052 RepID=A0ABU3GWD9_9SPHI|nr:hypothetical protein [Mucilaginibacter terrae]
MGFYIYMKKCFLALLVCLLTAAAAFAQKGDKPLVQFTGITYNADSTRIIIPYVTITNLTNKGSVVVANYKGYFSFVTRENDTLRFTAVGYAPVDMVIPANLESKSYTVKVLMKPEVIVLPAFHMLPWATTDEFKKDFLTMKLADDDLELARKNLSKGLTGVSYTELPRDASEIQSAVASDMHNRILNSHSLMPNPLLNPLAWGSLIKSISAGDKSRSN